MLCAQETKAPSVHTVIFWLHHPESIKDQMTFKDAAAEAVYQGDPTHQTII